jgi:hypothetical protein
MKKLICSLLIIAVMILSVTVVSATDDAGNDTISLASDESVADEVTAIDANDHLGEESPEGTFAELNDNITNAGVENTLTLEKNYKANSSEVSGIAIDRDITIDGAGHTIDANNKSINVFTINEGKSVTLKNIVFTGISSKFAVINNGNLTVNNCTFENNTSIKSENAPVITNSTFRDVETSINASAIDYKQDASINGTIDIGLNITKLLLNDIETPVSLENGNFYANVSNLTVGTYIITFRDDYGNVIELSENVANNLTVNPITANLTVNASVNEFGMIIINATVDRNVEGNITFIIADENSKTVINQTSTIIDGLAVFDDLKTYEKGNYTIFVTFSGDNYLNETENTTVEVDKLVPNISHITLVSYNAVTVIISLSHNATGNLSLAFSNGMKKTVTLKDGKAMLDFTDKPGTYSINVGYDGDDNYYALPEYFIDYTIKKASSVTSGNVNVAYNDNAKVTVTLVDSSNNAPIANALVFIVMEKKIYKSITDASGRAIFTIQAKLKPGTYKFIVKYGGNNVFDDSSSTYSFTVKKATPKITAYKKTFKKKTKTKKYKITLKEKNGKAIKSVKVTLKVKGKTYSAKTNSKGKATFKITKLKKAGKFTATITFKGNAYFKKVTKKVKITVKK